MDNIGRVVRHQRGKYQEAGKKDIDSRVLTLVPSKSGKDYIIDDEGEYWRTYIFLEGLMTLVKAIEVDEFNRAKNVEKEIDFVMQREKIVDVLLNLHENGELPERITHNDTKLNNVLINAETGEGMCVIDLDTVMPGLALYDFGDMVRTATNTAEEDERDLSKVEMNIDMYNALVDGYMSTAGKMLVPKEIELLPFSGQLITFEIGIRFLTDYLQNDVYFKIHRDKQNVDRCRKQFKMVESMERIFELI